jgi:hypothetical protein
MEKPKKKLLSSLNYINEWYRKSICFHPDESFADYVGIKQDEIGLNERRRNYIINACKEIGVDVYELTLAFQLQSYQKLLCFITSNSVIVYLDQQKKIINRTTKN